MDYVAWNSLASQLTQKTHMVQFYGGDPESLIVNVGRFLREGLVHGDALIVISSPEQNDAFAQQLAQVAATSGDRAVPADRVLFLDAEKTRAKILANGQLDLNSTRRAIDDAIGKAREQATNDCVRVYGDLVGKLWKSREYAASTALEDFWNEMVATNELAAFCGYPIDVCSAEFETTAEVLLSSHSHFVRTERNEDLEHAILRAMREVLGSRAGVLIDLMRAHHRFWSAAMFSKAEAHALWVRNELPDCADEILGRAARYYDAAKR